MLCTAFATLGLGVSAPRAYAQRDVSRAPTFAGTHRDSGWTILVEIAGIPPRERFDSTLTVGATGLPSTRTATCAPQRRVVDTLPFCLLQLPAGDTSAIVRAWTASADSSPPRSIRRLGADRSRVRLVAPRRTTLAAVRVVARDTTTASKDARRRGARIFDDPSRPVAAEFVPVYALTPDALGDLDAISRFALVPGLDGLALAGLSVGESRVLLNGMQSDIGGVPTLLGKSVGVQSSPWDPRVGGGAGAYASIGIGAGGRRHSGNVQAIVAPSVDPTVGSPPTRWSVGARGPIHEGLRYNVGVDAVLRGTAPRPFTSLDAPSLGRLGFDVSAVRALLDTASQIGLPAQVTLPDEQRLAWTAVGQLDWLPTAPATWNSPDPHTSLTLRSVSQGRRLQGSLLSASSAWREATAHSEGAQLSHRRYLGRDAAIEQTFALDVSNTRNVSAPITDFPAVIVDRRADAGALGARDLLQLGGAGIGMQQRRRTSAQMRSASVVALPWRRTPYLTVDATLRIAEAAIEDESTARARVLLAPGTALADPDAYTVERSDPTPGASVRALNAALAIGSLASFADRALEIGGGLRAEFDRALMPGTDARLSQRFGTSPSRISSAVALSPRLGFNWEWSRAPGVPRRAILLIDDDNGLRIKAIAPRLYGGVGLFRSNASEASLLDGTRTLGGGSLECAGVPGALTPWSALASDPLYSQLMCAAGSGVPVLQAGDAVLRDDAARGARSWRAEIGHLRGIANRMIASIDAKFSHTTGLDERTDLNLSEFPLFFTADEFRPVFAPASTIDVATARAPLGASRVDSAFGRVMRVSPIGASRSGVLGARLQLPASRIGVLAFSVNRTWAQQLVRPLELRRSAQLPSARWTPADGVADWQLGFLYFRRFGPVQIATSMQALSGRRFTPRVAGDVDQDGIGRDVAFLPASERNDTDVERDLAALRARLPENVARCLTSATSDFARRASCTGGWSLSSNLQFSTVRPFDLNGRSLHLTASLQQPLSLLGDLFRGAGRGASWTPVGAPDNTLLIPTGFDAQRRQYTYRVNPGFGRTSSALARQLAAPSLLFTARLELHPPEHVRIAMFNLGITGRVRGAELDSSMLVRALQRSSYSPWRVFLVDTVRSLVGDSVFAAWRAADAAYRAEHDATAARLVARWVGRDMNNPRVIRREYEAWLSSVAERRSREVAALEASVTDDVWARLPPALRRRVRSIP